MPKTAPEHPNRINLGWLLRLRGSMIAGQLVAIFSVQIGLSIDLPLVPLLVIVAIEAGLNAAAALMRNRREPQEWWLAGIMACDIVLFTGLLYFTGGPSNPFSFLYLVQIALAAVTVRAAWSWALTGLALAGSAVLFLFHSPLSPGVSHAQYMDLHLRGMWVAFGVAAAFIVYFLFRVRRALEHRDSELAESRRAAARQEARQDRLASLATLAAGAAHELSTPLGTIAIAVKELEHSHANDDDRETLADVRLIREQVDRCRAILERMASDAGESIGGNWELFPVAELVQAAVAGLPAGIVPIRSEMSAVASGAQLRVPQRAVVQALRGLIKNALEASPEGGEVCVRVDASENAVVFAVQDQGAGISPAVLDRVGEPFYTTKSAGRGMGLGVFLARAVAERLGGQLGFDSRIGHGTTARLQVPFLKVAAVATAGAQAQST